MTTSLPIADPQGARASERLACLLEVAGVINSSLELGVVLDRILTQARTILQAESGSIMLLDRPTGELRVLAAQGPRARSVRGRRQRLGEGVAGWVAEHGTPLLLRGVADDPRFRCRCVRPDVRDALCVPLQAKDGVLGVVSVSNHLGEDSFLEEDLDLLTALAHHASRAIRNAAAYEEMREQRKTVERLLREVTRAQEEERKRISLEIHDGPAQTMHAALRDLETLRVLVGREQPQSAAQMQELEHSIRQAIDETRALMVGLRPPCLDDMGLLCALRSYARQFEQRTGIRARVRHQGEGARLPGALESCLFRVAQEALTNVWKHAAATQAEVLLELRHRSCLLQISDNGQGFDPAAAEAKAAQHLGMRSLRDRTELIGGRLEVGSGPGQGTVVRVTAPLAEGSGGML